VIFDDKLSWIPHTKKVAAACNRVLYSLKPLTFILSHANKSILANALVLSHIKYASVVWLKPSPCNYKAIDNIIRRSARFVYGLLKYDSVTNLICSDLAWLYAKYQYKLDVLKLSYNILNNLSPVYFRNYISLETIERISTRHRVYRSPTYDIHSIGKLSFKYSGSKEIIDLPNTINISASMFSFKNSVAEFLLNVQFAEFCSDPHDSENCTTFMYR
jgi:hypothetical protein